VSPETSRGALLAAEDALAAGLDSLSPAEAFGAFLADDLVFGLSGADLARSKGAALALLAAPPLPDTRTSLRRAGGGVADDGHLGYTFGWLRRTGAEGAVTYGKYLATWRLRPEGWRVEAFLWRAAKRDPAPPPPGEAVVAGYHGTPAPGSAETLARAVLAADAELSALSRAEGYSVAFERFADARAVCFTNGDFQWGPAGVRDVFGRWAAEEELSWTPQAGRAAASGDLAWTAGIATMTVGTGAHASRSWSNYLTVWARQADGGWRWLLDADDARPRPP
jgi:ketosteroid isomerase-like protein